MASISISYCICSCLSFTTIAIVISTLIKEVSLGVYVNDQRVLKRRLFDICFISSVLSRPVLSTEKPILKGYVEHSIQVFLT